MEWKEVRLGDVCEIKHGFAYKGKYFSDTPTCDILVTPGNFTLSGGFKLDKPKFYNGPVEKDYILSKGDLIVTMTDLSKNIDTLGYSALVPEVKGLTFHHNQRIGLVENIANNVDKYFLYWIMRTPAYQSFIATHSSGTTVHHTSPKGIGNYIFKLPPLDDQRRIASILSSLDRKIELNNKINADLEEMAQAIFKNWFVDFEPFKDGKFVDSELGMIPEGWKVGKITDIGCLITDYVSNGSFASLKQNVHLYETKEYAQFIRNTDLKTNTFSVYVDKHSYDFLSKSTLYGNEIIISNVGDVGSVHLCPKLDIPMTLGNNIIMLRPNEKEYNYFLYLWFKYFSGQGLIQGIKGGSAQPKFNKTDFKNLPLLIPSFEIIERSYWIFESMFSILSSNVKENSRLSLLRDTLLPRLMSGEIEIPE